VDCFQARRRLAQRARRQQPSVTEASLSVDHGHFEIPRETPMLQPVVADDDFRAPVLRQERRGVTVGPDDHNVGTAPRVHQRFVTDVR
jgi:hypothetical protein